MSYRWSNVFDPDQGLADIIGRIADQVRTCEGKNRFSKWKSGARIKASIPCDHYLFSAGIFEKG